ncbi:helix-turn-helix transcriptional regulator [Clostridium sp. AM54-14XD]|uniref:helix-turn-helix transcriptional regulator n=1 Tax=Clostridium sp. AM54-14XD TaxID=2293037 RepID=UPI0026927292
MSKHAEATHNDKRYIELGYNISYYRKHKGYTQEQLAEKLDISRQHLGAVEALTSFDPFRWICCLILQMRLR